MNILRVTVVVINIILGIFLWLDFFSNFVFVGKYSEFVLPPIIGAFGFASYKFLVRNNQKNHRTSIYKLICFPAVIGGLMSLLMFIPPISFLTFFMVDNINSENQIQKEISPDGSQIATVSLGHAGLVDADDRISIRVRPRWLPLIEKEVYSETYPSQKWCSQNPDNCIQWINKDTIYISETEQEIRTDTVQSSLPYWLVTIIAIVWLIIPK